MRANIPWRIDTKRLLKSLEYFLKITNLKVRKIEKETCKKKKQRMQTKVSVQSKAKDLGQKQGVLEFSYVLCEKRGGKEARSLTAETSPTNFSSSVCSSSN